MFHVSIWGVWSFVWGAKPTKAPPWRRDWAHPQIFYLSKMWAKLLKIQAKSLKIRAKMTPNDVGLQKTAPNVCRKAHVDLFLEVTSRKGLHDLCWRKFVKVAQNFSGKFGEIRGISRSRPASIVLSRIYCYFILLYLCSLFYCASST